MKSVSVKAPNVPALSLAELLRRANDVRRRTYVFDQFAPDRAQQRLRALEAVVPEVEAIIAQLEEVSRPATREQVANQVALLIGAFPSKMDLVPFGKILCADVLSCAPPVSDLEAACREIRHTSRFLPSIAEVLTAIKAAGAPTRQLVANLRDLIASRDEVRREAEKERLRLEQRAAKRHHRDDDF